MLNPRVYRDYLSSSDIYALSDSVVGEVVEPCRQAGMNSYLGKPFQPAQLLAEIERVRLES